MANSESADLMSVGQHCSNPTCRQRDFLPFQCRRCQRVYCLEHRVCPCDEANKETVLVCPICAQAVVCPPGENVELVFDRHTRTDCDPSNYDRVHRKQRCPVAGCKEKLTSINTYTCRECSVTVCLKHRLPLDHKCVGKAAAAAASAAAAQSRLAGAAQSLRRMFSSSSGSNGSAAGSSTGQRRPPAHAAGSGGATAAAAAARPSLQQKAASVATKTKESIQSQLQQYRQQQRQRGQPPSQQQQQQAAQVVDLTGGSPAPTTATAASAGPEVCQQCGARFATVQQLIQHAEVAHASGWSSGTIGRQQAAAAAGDGGLERCPHCGQQFADPVQLVAHVERQHAAAAGSSRDTCVLC